LSTTTVSSISNFEPSLLLVHNLYSLPSVTLSEPVKRRAVGALRVAGAGEHRRAGVDGGGDEDTAGGEGGEVGELGNGSLDGEALREQAVRVDATLALRPASPSGRPAPSALGGLGAAIFFTAFEAGGTALVLVESRPGARHRRRWPARCYRRCPGAAVRRVADVVVDLASIGVLGGVGRGRGGTTSHQPKSSLPGSEDCGSSKLSSWRSKIQRR
jgi:hypothetical protein